MIVKKKSKPGGSGESSTFETLKRPLVAYPLLVLLGIGIGVGIMFIVKYAQSSPSAPNPSPPMEFPAIALSSSNDSGYTVSASSGSDVFKAFDNKLDTDWISADAYAITGQYAKFSAATFIVDVQSRSGISTSLGEWIQIRLPDKINLSAFKLSISKADDAPKNFTLVGSTTGQDNDPWQTLYVGNITTPWVDGETRIFNVNTANSFAEYRLVINQTQTNNLNPLNLTPIRISEWKLLGKPA